MSAHCIARGMWAALNCVCTARRSSRTASDGCWCAQQSAAQPPPAVTRGRAWGQTFRSVEDARCAEGLLPGVLERPTDPQYLRICSKSEIATAIAVHYIDRMQKPEQLPERVRRTILSMALSLHAEEKRATART